MKQKINWEKGSGEFIGFALISICISSIIILLVAILQYSSCLNDITKALEAAGRAVSVCTSFEDAEEQAQRVAESAVSDSNISRITARVSYVDGYNTWESGSFLTVTVTGKYSIPFFSGTSHKTSLITIENSNNRITDDDTYLLACIMECESSLDYNGYLAVGTIIMNRVESPKFPDSVYDVVYAPGQFEPVTNGRLESKLETGPNEIARKAAEDIAKGTRYEPVSDCYFFLAAESTNRVGTIVGGNVFFQHW